MLKKKKKECSLMIIPIYSAGVNVINTGFCESYFPTPPIFCCNDFYTFFYRL